MRTINIIYPNYSQDPVRIICNWDGGQAGPLALLATLPDGTFPKWGGASWDGYLKNFPHTKYGNSACHNVQVEGSCIRINDAGVTPASDYHGQPTMKFLCKRTEYDYKKKRVVSYNKWRRVSEFLRPGDSSTPIHYGKIAQTKDNVFWIETSLEWSDDEGCFVIHYERHREYIDPNGRFRHTVGGGRVRADGSLWSSYGKDYFPYVDDLTNSCFSPPEERKLWAISFDTADRLESLAMQGSAFPYTDGDLCQEAVAGCKSIDINTVMYLKEMAAIGEFAKSTIETIKNLKHPSPKVIADLYLSWHYGWRLTYKDTVEIIDTVSHEFQKQARSTATSRARRSVEDNLPDYHVWGPLRRTVTKCVNVLYNPMPNELKGLFYNLFKWDVFPELSNVYDFIPYSFVVDWLIPFGQALEQIDYYTFASTLEVQEVVRSTKIEVHGIPADSALVRANCGNYLIPLGSLSLVSYHRTIGWELSYPTLHVDLPESFHSWLPAGALILQRKR